MAARNYWVATTTSSGKAHSRPVWGVWLDSSLWFSTGSRIGTHLRARPDVTVHLESGDEVVIIEGIAALDSDPADIARFCEVFNVKYAWDFKPDDAGTIFVVKPKVAFGWVSDGSGLDHGAIYNATGTRWHFDE